MATDLLPNNHPPESSVGAAFVANNKAAATLSAIMLAGWSTYYAARSDLKQLASQSFQTPEDADLAVGQIVAAMNEKAKTGGLTARETLAQLQSVVLPYMTDLARRETEETTTNNEEIRNDE